MMKVTLVGMTLMTMTTDARMLGIHSMDGFVLNVLYCRPSIPCSDLRKPCEPQHAKRKVPGVKKLLQGEGVDWPFGHTLSSSSKESELIWGVILSNCWNMASDTRTSTEVARQVWGSIVLQSRSWIYTRSVLRYNQFEYCVQKHQWSERSLRAAGFISVL